MNAHAGVIVRTTRQARGLTLVELGRKAGFSASQVSRYERGRTPLTDTTVLRRFAAALELPPQALGLLPSDAGPYIAAMVPSVRDDLFYGSGDQADECTFWLRDPGDDSWASVD